MGEGTLVRAGNRRRVQVRKERKDGFTAAKRQVFLDHLASCCNIRRSAKAAGVTAETINYHRRTDPLFAQQCVEAIQAGYDMIESMSLEEAATGGHYVPGDTPVPEAKFDKELALHLLRLRRAPIGRRTGQAGQAPRRVSEKALNDSLLAKLEVLNRRRARVKRKKDSPSTSSGRTVVGRALKREEVRKLKTVAQAKAALAVIGEGAAPRSSKGMTGHATR